MKHNTSPLSATESTTNSRKNILPLFGVIVGGGALWYVWLEYNNLVANSGPQWNNWIQLGMISLCGILCILATFTFLLRKPYAWNLFVTGLSLIPLLLFFNLVILLVRVVQNLLQGNVRVLERVLDEPQKALFVLFIVMGLVLLQVLSKKGESSKE